MTKFSLSRRIFFIFFDLGLALITLTSFYFGLKRIGVYLSYPDVFVFSIFSVFSVLFFIISIPVIALSISPIFTGEQASIYFQIKMASVIKFGVLAIVLLSIAFNVIYTNKIRDDGYVKCHGVPSGWMPGMATKYSMAEHLCNQKTY